MKNSRTGTVFDVVTDVWGNGTEQPLTGNWNGTIGHDGEQVTVNYSVAGMSVGSTINGELWVGVSDHLGSGSVVRDSDGDTRVQRYTPFGAVRAPGLESGLPTDEGFTGQTADRGTGLVDYNARAYDPQLGRFVMADTVLDGLNRYSYVRNNPLRYTDPSGHMPNRCDYSRKCRGKFEPSPDHEDEITARDDEIAVEVEGGDYSNFNDFSDEVRVSVNMVLGGDSSCKATRVGGGLAVTVNRGGACGTVSSSHGTSFSQRVANAAGGVVNGQGLGHGHRFLEWFPPTEGKVDWEANETQVAGVGGVVLMVPIVAANPGLGRAAAVGHLAKQCLGHLMSAGCGATAVVVALSYGLGRGAIAVRGPVGMTAYQASFLANGFAVYGGTVIPLVAEGGS